MLRGVFSCVNDVLNTDHTPALLRQHTVRIAASLLLDQTSRTVVGDSWASCLTIPQYDRTDGRTELLYQCCALHISWACGCAIVKQWHAEREVQTMSIRSPCMYCAR